MPAVVSQLSHGYEFDNGNEKESLPDSITSKYTPIEINDGFSDLKSTHTNGVLPINGVKTRHSSKSEPVPSFWTTSINEGVKIRFEATGNGSIKAIDAHEMFTKCVSKYGDRKGLSVREGATWKSWTFREYYRDCIKAAKSFIALGLETTKSVNILGFNHPAWAISNFGAVFAGGISCGIYTTNTPDAVQYVAEDSKAQVIVVENTAQLKKVLQVRHSLPFLKAIVQYTGELHEPVDGVYTWEDFMRLGESVSGVALEERIKGLRVNKCATLIYTSGTTGNPKGVMLSHDNLVWTSHGAGVSLGLNGDVRQERIVSYLPLSHVAALVVDIYGSIQFGANLFFAQPDALKGSLVDTLRQVRPTAFLGVPRVWEKIQEKMQVAGSEISGLKRVIGLWAKKVGLRSNRNKMAGKRPPMSYSVADRLIYRKVKQLLGLDCCRIFVSAAAPLSVETLEYFQSMNIPITECYGMSECCGPHTLTRYPEYKTGTCGRNMLGTSTLISKPDVDGAGEILMYGRHVFMGYLNNEANTLSTFNQQGWLHTGDIGRFDSDEFLYITGRIKDLIITAGGENIPPILIEDIIKEELSCVSNAVLLGDKRKYLTCLVTLKCVWDTKNDLPTDALNFQTLNWCKSVGSSSQTVTDVLAGDAAVSRGFVDGFKAVNRRATSRAQVVQKWTILAKDFSINGGELGPTMKLKRPVVYKKYAADIEALYS